MVDHDPAYAVVHRFRVFSAIHLVRLHFRIKDAYATYLAFNRSNSSCARVRWPAPSSALIIASHVEGSL